MAYKRTTKTTKGAGGVTTRTTVTRNTKGNTLTASSSSKTKHTTFTRNSKGDVWLTTNQGGWITKRKLNKTQPKKSSKKAKPVSVGGILLFLVFIIAIALL